jgi:hypothetical protein
MSHSFRSKPLVSEPTCSANDSSEPDLFVPPTVNDVICGKGGKTVFHSWRRDVIEASSPLPLGPRRHLACRRRFRSEQRSPTTVIQASSANAGWSCSLRLIRSAAHSELDLAGWERADPVVLLHSPSGHRRSRRLTQKIGRKRIFDNFEHFFVVRSQSVAEGPKLGQ